MARRVKHFDHMIAELADANGLSPRRAQVLELVARGYTGKEIADELGISEDCVKGHIESLRDQFDAMNRVELVCQAWAHGVLKASPRTVFCLFGGFSAIIKVGRLYAPDHYFHRAQARLQNREAVGVEGQNAVAPLFYLPTTGDSGYYEIPAYLRKRIHRQTLDNQARLAAYVDRVQAHIQREGYAA